MANSHPRPRFHKGWEPLRKDLALTTRITAVEFANLEQELYPLSSTGGITHSAVIVALDGGRHDRAKGTTRRGMRCNGCDGQTVFGDFYLIDQHPLGKGKQWRSFHHHLVSQAKRESRGFFWKALYHRQKFCATSKQCAPNRAMSHNLRVSGCARPSKNTGCHWAARHARECSKVAEPFAP